MSRKIGIIGHAANKFNEETKRIAENTIRGIIGCETSKRGTPTIISGHSPMGGIDIWAEEIANEYGLPTEIKTPKQNSWDGEYGFKARNIDIAKCSDIVHVIVVDTYPANYKGMKFEGCYHCAKHPEMKAPHIKSGACWTGWKAVAMGKQLRYHIIHPAQQRGV